MHDWGLFVVKQSLHSHKKSITVIQQINNPCYKQQILHPWQNQRSFHGKTIFVSQQTSNTTNKYISKYIIIQQILIQCWLEEDLGYNMVKESFILKKPFYKNNISFN